MSLMYDEIKNHIPDEPGSVRINHDSSDCSGSSKSIIITTNPDYSVFAYCFRCDNRLRIKKKGTVFYNKPAREQSISTVELPKTFDLTGRGYEYIKSFNILDSNNIYKQAKSDYNRNIIIYPIYYDEVLTGFVTKNTINRDTFTHGSPFPKIPKYTDTLVITEDILSAAKVMDIRGIDNRKVWAYPLFGTNISNKKFEYICMKEIPNIIVWLDNDSDKVIRNARKIMHEFRMFTKTFNCTKQEPKKCTHDEIISVLRSVML